MDMGSHKRIETASVVNNIVRVEKDNNDIPRLLLESHYFFEPTSSFRNVRKEDWGHGPFIAIQPGKNDLIDAIGLGYMLGFKNKDTNTSSWNIGLGVVVDPNVKVLGDGIEENKPLPAGETQVRFKETSQWGVLFLTSFTF